MALPQLRELKNSYSSVIMILMSAMVMWIGFTSLVGHAWMFVVNTFFIPIPFRFTIIIGWIAGVIYIISGIAGIASCVIPVPVVQFSLKIFF
jgi:hypothetical protein